MEVLKMIQFQTSQKKKKETLIHNYKSMILAGLKNHSYKNCLAMYCRIYVN